MSDEADVNCNVEDTTTSTPVTNTPRAKSRKSREKDSLLRKAQTAEHHQSPRKNSPDPDLSKNSGVTSDAGCVSGDDLDPGINESSMHNDLDRSLYDSINHGHSEMMLGSSEMIESREQIIKPLMTTSWLDTVKDFSELEGDSAVFNQGSVECLNWTTQDTGRPESPLHFDHEEVLKIDSSVESSTKRSAQPSPSPHKEMTMMADSLDEAHMFKYSEADFERMKKEVERHIKAKYRSKEVEWRKEQEETAKKQHSTDNEVQNQEKKIRILIKKNADMN